MRFKTTAALFAAALMAAGTSAYAQQERGESRTQSSGHEAHSSASMGGQQSLTGCLEEGSDGGYTLKIALAGSADLEKHVGHKVKVTGMSGGSSSSSATQGASSSSTSSSATSSSATPGAGERGGESQASAEQGRSQPGAATSETDRAGQRGAGASATAGAHTGMTQQGAFQVANIQHVSESCDQ